MHVYCKYIINMCPRNFKYAQIHQLSYVISDRPTLEYCSGIYTKGRALKRPQILLSFYLKASILFNIYKCMICHWQTSKKIDRKRTHFVIFLNICMIANLKEFDGLKFWEFTLIYRIVWNDLKFQNNEIFLISLD